MKKKSSQILSLLLALMLIVSVFPTTAFAGSDGDAHTHHDKTFQPWTATDSLPTTPGSYYLTNDVTLSSTWYVPDGTTNLCLNGHGIRYSSYVTGCAISINVNAALNLYDCDTETQH